MQVSSLGVSHCVYCKEPFSPPCKGVLGYVNEFLDPVPDFTTRIYRPVSCGHKFHAKCITSFIREQEQTEIIRCPIGNCHGEIIAKAIETSTSQELTESGARRWKFFQARMTTVSICAIMTALVSFTILAEFARPY